MLAPEVWNMPPTPSRNTVLHNINKLKNTLTTQYFNHSVLLVIPDCLHPPDEVSTVLTIDTDYYHISSLPLSQLFNLQFISLFVRTGKLTLHSVDTRVDLDNAVGITPNGIMVLSLQGEMFHKLGLEGEASKYVADRFVVKLDLKSDFFTTDSKRLNKLLERLKILPQLTFNVICSWEPNDVNLCPSSLAAWFSEASFSVRQCSNRVNRKTRFDLEMPDMVNDPFVLQEWAAMIHLECELSEQQQAISSYSVPSPSTRVGQITSIQWTGMMTAACVTDALTKLESWVKSRDSNIWVLMSVQGMDDSVTSFGEEEHQYYVEGDYSTTVIIHPTEPTVGIVHVSSCKAPQGRKRKRREKV